MKQLIPIKETEIEESFVSIDSEDAPGVHQKFQDAQTPMTSGMASPAL